MRTVGLTSIRTPFAVWMKICSRPALLIGESRRVRRHCKEVNTTHAAHYWLSNLMGNIGSSVANIAIHLAHYANMFVAVEKRILLVTRAWSPSRMRCFVGLKTGIGQYHDHPRSILVGRRDRNMLLSYQIWEFWRWERLGSWHEDRISATVLC